jgi:hypothetical protein
MPTDRGNVKVFRDRCDGVVTRFSARKHWCANMAVSGEQKAFCVLQFAKIQSIVTVQRGFRNQYRTEPPMDKTVRHWYRKFVETGCLYVAKRTGRPGPSPGIVDLVRVCTSVESPKGDILNICKVGSKLRYILFSLTCSHPPYVIWLLSYRPPKSRRDLWNILYILYGHNSNIFSAKCRRYVQSPLW